MGLVLLTAVLAAGCSSETAPGSGTADPSVAPGAAATPGSAATPGTRAAPSPSASATPLEFELPEDDEEPYPEWDPASREQAVASAEQVMHAFVRPADGTDTAAWWGRLSPLLTPEGQEAYGFVDAAEVPATAVTGPAVLVEPEPGATAFLAAVQVPTDVGPYDVLLARTGASTPWLAERISPPESLSGPPTAPPDPA